MQTRGSGRATCHPARAAHEGDDGQAMKPWRELQKTDRVHHSHSCLRAAVVSEPGCSQNHPLPEPGLCLGSGAWKAVVEAIPAQPEPQNCFWGHGKRSWAAGRAEGRGGQREVPGLGTHPAPLWGHALSCLARAGPGRLLWGLGDFWQLPKSQKNKETQLI